MDVTSWLLGDWTTVLRTVTVGVGAYVFLVLVLRISGKRTLAKLNAFDLIVTVALGSTLASVLVSKTTSLAQGATAFVTLAGLQGAITWLSTRSSRLARIVRSEPAMLLVRGQMLDDAIRAERMTEAEILSAIRSAGLRSVDEAFAVILEANGTLAVIRYSDGAPTALADVSDARS